MANTLTVIARVTAKPGCEADVRRELLRLVEASRKEDGCINYDLHVSLDNPAQFVFYENWRDAAAHTAHHQTPHMQAWRARREPLLAGPPESSKWTMLEP